MDDSSHHLDVHKCLSAFIRKIILRELWIPKKIYDSKFLFIKSRNVFLTIYSQFEEIHVLIILLIYFLT